VIPDPGLSAIVDGSKYQGPAANAPFADVSALVDTAGATVVSAQLLVGTIGVYQVQIEINSTVTADSLAQATISQGLRTSNIVTIPVGSPPTQ
jgi:hypothetical protein